MAAEMLKIGQVWLDGYGDYITITGKTDLYYYGDSVVRFHPNGKIVGENAMGNLVKKVRENFKIDPSEFAVGQVWMSRDEGPLTILSIDPQDIQPIRTEWINLNADGRSNSIDWDSQWDLIYKIADHFATIDGSSKEMLEAEFMGLKARMTEIEALFDANQWSKSELIR